MCAIEAFYCALWLSLAMVLSLSFHFKKLEMSFQFTNCDMRMHNWHSKVSSPASHLLFHMYVFTTIFNFSNLATSSPLSPCLCHRPPYWSEYEKDKMIQFFFNCYALHSSVLTWILLQLTTNALQISKCEAVICTLLGTHCINCVQCGCMHALSSSICHDLILPLIVSPIMWLVLFSTRQ